MRFSIDEGALILLFDSTCDMHLLSLIGSRERDLAAWERLFTTADARFKLLGAKRPQESMLSIIEVRFEDLPN